MLCVSPVTFTALCSAHLNMVQLKTDLHVSMAIFSTSRGSDSFAALGCEFAHHLTFTVFVLISPCLPPVEKESDLLVL